jgi:DNA-binding NtrC family response regulator
MKQLILVVDDEQGIREILQEDLIAEGFEVRTASTINLAIQLIKNNHFQYIFSDYHMSSGDSMDLLKEARRIDPKVPFFIVSGFADDVEARLISLGVTGILKKPYSINDLKQLFH